MTSTAAQKTAPRIHWAWVVAAVSFVAILGAAGFRSVPGVMMNPLHHEFGWSHGVVGLAMSVNMTLFGLTAPFAAALMDRFGVRPVLSGALLMIASGSALSVTMTASWQLVLLWGVLVGAGTGAISMGFVATIATRWFESRRGLVTGVLTAASATGQLIFLPVVAAVTERHGWRWASLIVAAAALCVVPLVLLFMRNYPQDKGLTAYGATASTRTGRGPCVEFPRRVRRTADRRARAGVLAAGGELRDLRDDDERVDRHALHPCGQRPRHAHDRRGRPAGHHRHPRRRGHGVLRLAHRPRRSATAAGRLLHGPGALAAALPSLLSPQAEPSTWVFVIFYGLDWVATVPPTIVLCRNYFGNRSPVVFGWVFASHQLGAAVAAAGAGWLRDLQGGYDMAFYLAGGLCFVAAALCGKIRKAQVRAPAT